MDELFKELQAAGIRYLVVGGQAMRLMGMPRYSMDREFLMELERLGKLTC